MSDQSDKLFGLAGEFDNNISYPKSMETRQYISSTLILAGKEIESLEKENAALRAANESVAVCSDHVLDIKGTGCLVCENAALREKVAKLTAAIDYVTEETGYYTPPSEDAK